MTTGKDILRRDSALFQLVSVNQGQVQHPSVLGHAGVDKRRPPCRRINVKRLADGGINLVAAGTDCRTDRCQNITGLRGEAFHEDIYRLARNVQGSPPPTCMHDTNHVFNTINKEKGHAISSLDPDSNLRPVGHQGIANVRLRGKQGRIRNNSGLITVNRDDPVAMHLAHQNDLRQVKVEGIGQQPPV